MDVVERGQRNTKNVVRPIREIEFGAENSLHQRKHKGADVCFGWPVRQRDAAPACLLDLDLDHDE